LSDDPDDVSERFAGVRATVHERAATDAQRWPADTLIVALEAIAMAEQLARHELGDHDAGTRLIEISTGSQTFPGLHALAACELVGAMCAQSEHARVVLSDSLRRLINARETMEDDS
jgi:hypothetical protein